uniref:Uncharacterized protein n=1 Tax=Lepeophtheirus salmonis TaxID=72036 RepID=A0A0K2VAU9_LEPSM
MESSVNVMASEYKGQKVSVAPKGRGRHKRLVQRWKEGTASFVEKAMFSRRQNALRFPGVGRWVILEYAVRHLCCLVLRSLSS